MSYCTQQDLVDRYSEDEIIQLTDRDNEGSINSAVVDRAIADAEGDIDAELGSRFGANLTVVPKTVVRIACEITRYYLYEDMATEHVRNRFNDAKKLLKQIGKGDVSIGVDVAGAKPQSNNMATMTSGGNMFNRNSSKGFI